MELKVQTLNLAQVNQIQGGAISDEAFYGASFAAIGAVSTYVLRSVVCPDSTELMLAMGQTGILTGTLGVVYGAIVEEHRV